VLRVRRPVRRPAVQLPGVRPMRSVAGRRLVAGGSTPGSAR